MVELLAAEEIPPPLFLDDVTWITLWMGPVDPPALGPDASDSEEEEQPEDSGEVDGIGGVNGDVGRTSGTRETNLLHFK